MMVCDHQNDGCCRCSRCLDRQYFMLRDDLWTEACGASGVSEKCVLCIRCVERALGRQLDHGDFPSDIPLNRLPTRDPLVASRTGRRLLVDALSDQTQREVRASIAQRLRNARYEGNSRGLRERIQSLRTMHLTTAQIAMEVCSDLDLAYSLGWFTPSGRSEAGL